MAPGLLRRLDGAVTGFERGAMVWLGDRDGVQLTGGDQAAAG